MSVRTPQVAAGSAPAGPGGDRERPGSRSASRIAPWLYGLAPVVLWAVVSAWWVPRGPVSTTESLTCLLAGVGLGILAGWATGSGWAALGAPVAFVLVYEVARSGVDGPTVDGLGTSVYGAIAFVTGRGFHAAVALAPMAWGAALGVAAHRRRTAREGGSTNPVGRTRAALLVVSGLALVALAVVLARPAATAPITGADGRPLPDSVAELTSVRVGDHELGLMVRGVDRDNPVLLFLAGGPGGSELGAMRRHLPALEEHFTVVTWDQRGTGRSYGELDPVETLTVDAAVADTLAVTDHLRTRFSQDEVYLVGQSWGSTLGVLAVQAAPERYAAFVGVGQMVSQRATDTIYHRDTLRWAEETGRADLAALLREMGPPPYADPRRYEAVLSHEMEMYPYDHGANSEGAGQMSENLLVPEYSLTEQVRLLSGTLDTFAALYPQLQDIDFRRTATQFDVPVFFVQGAHEAPGRARLFEDWYPRVSADVKDCVVLDTSGHRPLFEQPDAFVAYLVDVVVPRAEGSPAPSPTPTIPGAARCG